MMMSALLDQYAELDFHSARLAHWNNSPRMRGHVAPFGHIILIPSQPVFALTPLCCMLSGEATNTNLIVFGLTQPGLEHTIYRTRGEHANNYTTDVVLLWNIITETRQENSEKYSDVK